MKRAISIAVLSIFLAGASLAHPGSATDPDDINDPGFKVDVKTVTWSHDDDRIEFIFKTYTRWRGKHLNGACYEIDLDDDPEMELGAVIVRFGGESPGFGTNVYEGACGGSFPVQGANESAKKTGPRTMRLDFSREVLATVNDGVEPNAFTFALTVNFSGQVDRVPNGKKSLTVEL